MQPEDQSAIPVRVPGKSIRDQLNEAAELLEVFGWTQFRLAKGTCLCATAALAMVNGLPIPQAPTVPHKNSPEYQKYETERTAVYHWADKSPVIAALAKCISLPGGKRSADDVVFWNDCRATSAKEVIAKMRDCAATQPE